MYAKFSPQLFMSDRQANLAILIVVTGLLGVQVLSVRLGEEENLINEFLNQSYLSDHSSFVLSSSSSLNEESTQSEIEPKGFPLYENATLGVVRIEKGVKQILWSKHDSFISYSVKDQISQDPLKANKSGWNCRTHLAYEGSPAVDWYVPVGTPVKATMDGKATLYITTVSNSFDYYNIPREPYLGYPRLKKAPFEKETGGKGVFVVVENESFATEYAHLDLYTTVQLIPRELFLEGFDPEFQFDQAFGKVGEYTEFTPVASWQVKKGDLLGFSGDTGYSEAPHLHYAVKTLAENEYLCPTKEPGFENNGWLVR